MRIPIASFRHRRRLVGAGLLWLALAASLASAGALADGDGSPSSSPQGPVDPAESAPQWTFSAEAIGLARQGGVNQTLVARVPGNVPFYAPSGYDSATYPGVEALNSDQFRQGFSAGPKLSLTYRDNSGYGVELSYFNVLGLSAAKAVGPDNPPDWLVMKAPGTFWQTQDFPYQAMAWKDATSLYSVEANGRLDLSPRVTALAGLRWLHLNDSLQGTLTPADRTAPTWKQTCYGDSLLDLPSQCSSDYYPGVTAPGIYPPFWTTSVTNNLYGAQIGLEGKLLELGRLSLDGTIKAGLFDDNAEQSTTVSMRKQLFPSQAAANHAAFAGEAGLQVKYQLTKGLALKAGYEALWLDGVALAPGQIQETSTTQTSVSALGVNCRSSALFQGGTVGLEYSF